MANILVIRKTFRTLKDSCYAELKWAVIDSKEIIPVYNNDLEKKLFAVMRTYQELDDKTGNFYVVYEIWNDVECAVFRKRVIEAYTELVPNDVIL